MKDSLLKRFAGKSNFVRHLYWNTSNRFNKILLPDEAYYRKKYKKRNGVYPDLHNPQTFSEKLIWCMLNYRNNLFIQCADKYAVREFVKLRVGEQYLIPCYGIYEKLQDIDIDKLPDSFVLKATHGSGWNIICKEKNKLNRKKALSDLKYWLTHNYYDFNREWPYRYMQPRIICEKYIGDENGVPPMDYKIFCFNGEPKFIQLDISRFGHHQRNIYDIRWNLMKEVKFLYEQNLSQEYPHPQKLTEMLEIAQKLSAGFNFVRIDLYCVREQIFCGEMTFFPEAAVHARFTPANFNLQLGSWFTLPQRNIDRWKHE